MYENYKLNHIKPFHFLHLSSSIKNEKNLCHITVLSYLIVNPVYWSRNSTIQLQMTPTNV